MTLQSTIADCLLDSLPAASYGLPALVQLSEIVVSTRVPSAAVECTSLPRLLINPEFVAAHANTPSKLAMLVLHELHHVILGHTRLYPRMTRVDNLAFDAVINAMLCRTVPNRAAWDLFTDFYSDRKFPECFLRPAECWTPGWLKAIPRGLRGRRHARWADLHVRLYSEESVGYDELREAFAQHRSARSRASASVTLLGDHRPEGSGASSDGDLAARAPELLEHVRRIVERWPQPPTPRVGRSLSQFLEPGRVVVPPPSNRARLRAFIGTIARRVGSADFRRPSTGNTVIESPVLVLDRRAVVLRALGHQPALYRHGLRVPTRERGGERVHIYLDVSGSMQGVIGALYRAVLDCDSVVHPTVHLFSTEVVDVGLDVLRKGQISTTGGTSIECVAEHMRTHGVRRAVILTDGYVGAPGASSLAVLNRVRLGVVLFGENCWRDDLAAVADRWLELNGGAA